MSWSLQHVGNWSSVVSKTSGADDSPYETRTHNTVNEIAAIDPQGAVGQFTVVSDDAGNLSELPDRTDPTDKCDRFTYDYRNRLIKVEHTDDYDGNPPTWSVVVEYEYDGLNRRVKKDLPGGGTDVIYLYDGWRCIEERELDGGTWEARRQYVYGGRYIDEVLLFDKDTDDDGDCNDAGGSTRYLYCQNNNYNVVALTDKDGVVVEKVKYDPYGTPTCIRTSDSREQTASHYGNPYLVQGRRYDSESGLYYFRHRYLSPTLGRFMQRDPIGYADGMNLYEILHSTPLALSDPYGLYRDWTEHIARWALVYDPTPGSVENPVRKFSREYSELRRRATIKAFEHLRDIKERERYSRCHSLRLKSIDIDHRANHVLEVDWTGKWICLEWYGKGGARSILSNIGMLLTGGPPVDTIYLYGRIGNVTYTNIHLETIMLSAECCRAGSSGSAET
ncbi:MAG: hypothetical protein DRI01_10040, partial [Chloroflexi bacterium]